MLTSICYSFLVIQSALVKYWHQAKNVSLTWMGQTVLGTEWTRGSFRLFLMSAEEFLETLFKLFSRLYQGRE